MSLMKQVGLLAAGCQPWNLDVCAANSSGERFAYCATLAVYVYEHQQLLNEFSLTSIMAEHKRTITSISWNPRNKDIFATASTECRILVWNVAEQRIVAHLDNVKSAPSCIGWCPHEADAVAYIYGRGPLFIWNFAPPGGGTVSKHLESMSFYSNVCQFRWHPKKMGKLVFGHVDGSISVVTPGQKPCKHYLRPESIEDADEEDPITCLEWDPLSTDYLLVSNVSHGIRLVDSESMNVVMNFKLPSSAAKIHTLAWVPSASGVFLTGDLQVGVLRVWNVSKSTPIKNLKLKKTGFHAMHVIAPVQNGSFASNHMAGTSSTSAAVEAPSSPNNNNSTFLLPPANVLCTFLDGGVGLYDLGKNKWSFLRDMGHVETIFDCKFKPENPDLLATASFDGTLKVWDVNTMSAVQSSPGNEGIIYALSWAPGDLNCIVGATAKQGAFVWDIDKGKVIRRFNEHGKHSVFNVNWNHKDSRRIASVGADGTCVVRQVDGQLVKRYKHPGAVYGCDWSLNNRDMLATGCEDKCVRVFYVAANTDQPLKVFSGHTAKVFHVKWSPLREGVLCSGSDDGTVRIWDYTEDFCVQVLEGHTAPVRGLLWNPEIPFLLISGSWDYTIKVWDTRDGRCLDTVLDHGADVYGLSCHRHRPFTVASCSRDSTLRVWSIAKIASAMQINILANRPLTQVVSSNLEQSLADGAPPVLVGRMSREMKGLIENASENSKHLMAVKLFSDFFTPPFGAKNLWDLVCVLNNSEQDMLRDTYSKGIMHIKHVVKYKASEAQELELVKMSRHGAGLGAASKDDRLREAANIHIKIGEVQRYCELMVELGEWDKAIAVAPSVSMDYWESLSQRRTAQLVKEDSDTAIPYCVATGDIGKLVSFYTSRGQLHDSLLVAQVAAEGGFPCRERKDKPEQGLRRNDALPTLKNHVTTEHSSLLQTTSTQLADCYFHKGQPVLSACCHLAVGNVKLALSKLIRGNELELAVSIGKVLNDSSSMLHLATELLARKCEQLNRWDLAVTLLKSVPCCGAYLVKTCARCQGTNPEIDELHLKAGLGSLEECFQKAEELCEQEKFAEAMPFYLLSTSPELALDIGLNLVRDAMSKQYWVLDDVLSVVELMSCVRTDRLLHNKAAKQRHELVALSAYLGALLAMRRQYTPVVHPLFKHARYLMHRDKVDLAVSTTTVQAESEAWLVFSQPENPSVTPTPEQKTVWDALVQRAGTETSDYGTGVDIVSGSHLPCHSEIHVSYLTKEKIKGPVFLLEDGKSFISLNNALMWAKVNAFSPLGTGARINPF